LIIFHWDFDNKIHPIPSIVYTQLKLPIDSSLSNWSFQFKSYQIQGKEIMNCLIHGEEICFMNSWWRNWFNCYGVYNNNNMNKKNNNNKNMLCFTFPIFLVILLPEIASLVPKIGFNFCIVSSNYCCCCWLLFSIELCEGIMNCFASMYLIHGEETLDF
jgi:hypothetical protein